MKRIRKIILMAVGLLLSSSLGWADSGVYRPLGYLYLSPLPGAEYSSPQTKFVLVRFTDISPPRSPTFRSSSR